MKRIIYTITSIVALAIAGCTKHPIQQYSAPASGVLLKFFHAAPGVPGLNAFVNNVQITPTGSVSVTDNLVAASIVTGVTYNNVFPGSNYSVLTPGSIAIKLVTSTPVPALISAQTVAPATTIGALTQNIALGEAYSVFAAGLPGSTTTPLTALIFKDVFPQAVAGKAYIRVAHLVPNGGSVDISGVYTPTGSVSTTILPLTAAKYGTMSDFVAIDVNPLSTTSYVFQAYTAGTTTKFGTTTTISIAQGRYYTLVYRGLAADYAVPGTSITLKASARPTLSTDPTSRYPEIYFNAPGLTYYTNK